MNYLVKKAQKGNPDAFVELIELNKVGMYKIAFSYLHNNHDVADAMQEAILACYEQLEHLKHPKYFKTWMIRILINKCNDVLAANKKECLVDDFPDYPQSDSSQSNLEFEELLLSMDEKYSTVLILHYVHKFTSKEIGEMLELNENTVKTRLSRGRRIYAKECNLGDLSEGGEIL